MVTVYNLVLTSAASGSRVPWRTCTCKAVLAIETSGCILTRVTGTLVNICNTEECMFYKLLFPI